MKTPLYVRDLRIGSVIRDGRITYKLLSKSPGACYVQRTEVSQVEDTSVMPSRMVRVEKTTRLHIAPTARLADFGTGRATGQGGA